MDKYDIHIIQELQVDGRLSNRELAGRVGLTPPPCWRRVQQLERDGIISGYMARLDPDKIGLSILAFAHISLENHHADTIAGFLAFVEQTGEILECHMTSGEHDYMLKVVATDMKAYQEFITSRLLVLPAIRTVNTSFSLGIAKNTPELPLDQVQEPARG